MAKHPTLLEHFRSFAYQNKIQDLDKALAYFAVFGGTGWDVDASKSIEILIEEKVLRNYESLHENMTRYTHNNPVYHRLLSIIALGTEHEHDVFKKAKIGKERGEDAIDYLEKKSLLMFDLSVEEPLNEADAVSDRLLFRLPFMRFWFAMISANYKNISEGDFGEFEQKWSKAKENFHILLSNLLVRELLREEMDKKVPNDPIVTIGSYYDKQTYIDLLAKRKSGKMIAGACKYSKAPAKSNMPETLKVKCEKAELDAGTFVLFSKNGFEPELKESENSEMLFLSQRHLATLLDDLSKDDLLVYKNKKY